MAVSKKMESDSYDRIEASGKAALASAEKGNEAKGGGYGDWESKLSEGCNTVYTLTATGLKERNGRGGSQAGV